MTYFNQNNKSDTNSVAKKEVSTASTTDTPAQQAQELLALFESIGQINFDKSNALALDCAEEILEHWLPDGELKGVEYKAHNPTRDDSSSGSFSINIAKGLWSDFATGDVGRDLISLIAYLEGGIPQQTAGKKILEFIAGLSVEFQAKRNNAAAREKVVPEYLPLMPVPQDAKPRTRFFGADLGRPSSTWEYKDASGELLLCVHRFDTVRGKEFRPETYCQDLAGHRQWRLQGPTSPRPAYGLDRLAARPDAQVLFAEGEKAADAAQRLFPEFVAVTTMNGAKSPEKTDFSPFAGRKVYISPDNDDAGAAYKDKLVSLLQSAGAEIAGVMRLDLLMKDGADLAKGYDLADAEADGWTAEAFAALGDGLWETIAETFVSTPSLSTTDAFGSTEKKRSAGNSRKRTTLEFSLELADSQFGGHVASLNNQMLAYSRGYWKPLNIDVEVKKPILSALGIDGTASGVSRVYELMKIQYASAPELFERNSSLICLNNGTLNPATGELLSHCVDHYLTNKVDIAFDVNAKCPLWLQTLDEIFAPDLDKADKIRLLQEYIGYCLVPDTRMHKFLWLVGSGGNGKSLILSILTALIGKHNISYAQIERLQEKFVRAELQGKLVNISSEMSAQSTVSDGYLKQITAGDIIEAERKNEKPFSFKPYSRLIGATNVLPRLLDHSDGFFRRALIVRFNRQFKEAEQDNKREENLLQELPGILTWAVLGLRNLMNRNRFIVPSSSEAEIASYRTNSDPVRQFSEDFLTVGGNSDRWIASGALYDRYKAWSSESGYKTLAINQFSERLIGIGIQKTRRRDGRYWQAEYDDRPFGSIGSAIPPLPPTIR